ncbi:hypothetical protein [Streptomyces sp. KL116D]|uniref:hypothetical protein n=1 Tax=Streptomyces sp. KL116D TaxID=3045152 RepID=UPI0035579FB2
MRLRTTVPPPRRAGLAIALPTSASAATGDFSYRVRGHGREPQSVTLHDPAGWLHPRGRGRRPGLLRTGLRTHNDTDEWVMVFTEPDCTGDSWTLRPHGNPTTENPQTALSAITGKQQRS